MNKLLAVVIGAIIVFILLLAFFPALLQTGQYEVKPAYEFTAVDEEGVEFSLNNLRGNVTLLHFTGLENPICIECECRLVEKSTVFEDVFRCPNCESTSKMWTYEDKEAAETLIIHKIETREYMKSRFYKGQIEKSGFRVKKT